HQGIAICFRQIHEFCLRVLSLATMPQDGFFQGSGASVVQEACARIDGLSLTNAPKWTGFPLATGGIKVTTSICQAITHVMQKHVGERIDFLIRKSWDLVSARCKARLMAACAADIRKDLASTSHNRILSVTTAGDS